jgi:hypothetical protein
MITDVGKNIIAKYLISQAPAYASYIAVGCGSKPRINVSSMANASSSGNVITVADTAPVWIGAKVVIVSGTGEFSQLQETRVTAVLSSTTFKVFPAPTVALNDATVAVEITSTTNVMDFEMFRVPITSRGYVNDDGVNKVVFTAQLPSEERYEISEIGVYSAGANSRAGIYDSKVLYAFSQDEGWEYHNPSQALQIVTVNTPLDNPEDPNGGNNIISDQEYPVFQTTADNRLFTYSNRIARYERPRFLNNVIMMRGSDANLQRSLSVTNITGDGTVATYTLNAPHYLAVGDKVTVAGVTPSGYNVSQEAVTSIVTPQSFTLSNTTTDVYVGGGTAELPRLAILDGSSHIHLTGTVVDLDRNSPTDVIKTAFSIVNRDGTLNQSPDRVRLLIEFASSDVGQPGEYARFEIDIENGKDEGQYDFEKNRYVVITKELQDLFTSIGFTWNIVNVVKIYATAIVNDQPSGDYYIALDAIRLDNVSTPNPLYGLTGYSIIQNQDSQTVIKRSNTDNYIEFRYALDVT